MNKPDPEFLRSRLETISEGFKEAIRREVRRLRERGLPVYVAKNGTVVALPDEKASAPRGDA